MPIIYLISWIVNILFVLQYGALSGLHHSIVNEQKQDTLIFDIVVLRATPAGLCAAIAAARHGKSVAIVERTNHIGGLLANGLCNADIQTRMATGGLFKIFTDRVLAHYISTYGDNSVQAKACLSGLRYEAHVAETVWTKMLAENPKITLITNTQFDALATNVEKNNNTISAIKVLARKKDGINSWLKANVFIDASYEGDLAAAAGCRFRVGREARSEFGETLAGVFYKQQEGDVCEGSTYAADTAIQAYNFRMCLTNDEKNRRTVKKPDGYDRNEYVSLASDIKKGVVKGFLQSTEGSGVFNAIELPNGKIDADNHQAILLSSDLPEENWPFPKAGWLWRDDFEKRLRNYTLGLIYFVQQDTAVPEWFRAKSRDYGLAKDEYKDNDNFPRQVYVREARRVVGHHLFSAHDAQAVDQIQRPPVHPNSVASAHYAIDSHAMRKREKERCHLDGSIRIETAPYTVPFGAIVPVDIDNLLTPVPVSATHLGFSTLRMEPCRMALGEAAGEAAAIAIDQKISVYKIDVKALQARLLLHRAVLMFFNDVNYETHPEAFAAIQYFSLRGFTTDWYFRPDEPVSNEEADNWHYLAGFDEPHKVFLPGQTTRAQLLSILYNDLNKKL